jgi:NhaP-type Na+/H+ and K+/H+ antiporter
MAQNKLQRDAETISCLMSIFMTMAALVYVFVLGMHLKPEQVSWIMMVPPISLLVAAMWFLIKPAKVEW